MHTVAEPWKLASLILGVPMDQRGMATDLISILRGTLSVGDLQQTGDILSSSVPKQEYTRN